MKKPILVLALLGIALSLPKVVWAQFQPEPTLTYTLAIYNSIASDPQASPHVGPDGIYPVGQVTCGLSKATAPTSPNNPTKTRFDDPADATKDCEVNMTAQIAALPPGTGYKAALKANGATTASPYSAFASNSFNRVSVAPPTVTGVRIIP